MAPLHEKQGVVVDPGTKPPRCQESCSDDGDDNEEVLSSTGDARADETPISISSSHQNIRGEVTFPIKLHEMLMDVEREDNGSIVSWSPDGKGFRVHKQNSFVKTILPRYFSQTKYRSFQRQLNHYGFDRIIKGPYEGGYRHPDFVKDDPSRCRSMRRLKRNTIPKRVPRGETPSRHNDNCLYGSDKVVVAVSPEPSHHGSPKRNFEPTRESLISFPSPMFRPVPQYHRARIVTGTPLPVHPPGTRVYYHNHPLPSQPRVTHVYYIAPPDFHHTSPPPYHVEYPHGGRAPPTYHAYYAEATVVPLSPHNHVHLRPSFEEIPRRNTDHFFLSPPLPARNPPMGMVPVEEEQVVPEPDRAAVPLESSKAPRHRRHSFSSVNSNQEKSIDDLLLDFLSDDDQQGPPIEDGDDDEILSSFTRGKNVRSKNPPSQFAANEPECDYSHDLVHNFKGCSFDQSSHPPQLDPTEATRTVAL